MSDVSAQAETIRAALGVSLPTRRERDLARSALNAVLARITELEAELDEAEFRRGANRAWALSDEREAREAAEARVAELEAERDDLRVQLGNVTAIRDSYRARDDAAEAQVRQLREALEQARTDIGKVYLAGFDSDRRAAALESVRRIDAAFRQIDEDLPRPLSMQDRLLVAAHVETLAMKDPPLRPIARSVIECVRCCDYFPECAHVVAESERVDREEGRAALDDPGSSSGRTPGFDPGDAGSSPAPGTDAALAVVGQTDDTKTQSLYHGVVGQTDEHCPRGCLDTDGCGCAWNADIEPGHTGEETNP